MNEKMINLLMIIFMQQTHKNNNTGIWNYSIVHRIIHTVYNCILMSSVAHSMNFNEYSDRFAQRNKSNLPAVEDLQGHGVLGEQILTLIYHLWVTCDSS